MNEYKFQFIICSNNEEYLEECILYISLLEIPEGYSIDVISVLDASSMTSGYNEGMNASDARYKIYLHQDVFIIYKKFLYALLEIFGSDEQIGMIGMVGSPQLPSCGIQWYGLREGGLYGLNAPKSSYLEYEYHLEDGLHEVEAVDGLMMITNQDVPWREDLFDGWDFYDVSQSLEFRKRGFKIVVPEQFNPWCKHDDGFLNMEKYNKYRKVFLNEYREMIEPLAKDAKSISEDIMVYLIIYHENAAAGESALAEKLREEFDKEGNAVYYIGISENDTYEECIESFYAFHPDVIVTVNCAGFSLEKENGELLYNALYCDCIHVIADIPWRYGYCLTKRMNFTSTFVVADQASRDYIERYCENVPKVLYRPELKRFTDVKGKEKLLELLDTQPEVYKKIAKELIKKYQQTGDSIEPLLEEYLKEHHMSVNDEEFVDLLIQMKDAAEYIQTEKAEKDKPLISVVLPTYNREKTLKAAMTSVLNQSYSNLELIIADDCSSDNTKALVEDMMKEDKRIRYIKGEKNAGANAARNMGASIAIGDYIAFIDSDAVWKENKLERQLGVFKEHSEEEIGMVFHVCILSKEDKSEEWLPYEHKSEEFSDEMMLVYLLDKPLVDTSTIMMPMQIWKAVGGFDVRRKCLQDYEFSLRVAKQYRVCYFHEPLAITYYSPGSVSQNWKEGIKTYFYVLEKYAEQYKVYETIKWKRIFLMWNSCRQLGYDEFFKEEYRIYVKEVGEDLYQLGQQMQKFINEHTTLNGKWDIFE